MMPPAHNSHDSSKGRKMQLKAAFLVLVLIFMSIAVLFIRYLQQPAPLPELILPQTEFVYPPHYLYSIYGVEEPVGVTVSPDGLRIYAAESAGLRLVKVFDRSGEQVGALLPPQTRPGERTPVYLATDSFGRVFVTDRLQHAVYIYDREHNFVDMLLAPNMPLSFYVSQFAAPVTDKSSYNFNLFHQIVTFRSQPGSEGMILPPPEIEWSPLGIRIDGDGQVWVTDVSAGQNCVVRLSLPDGDSLAAWRDANFNVMQLGSSGSGQGELSFPNAAMSDSQGRLYISDGNNGRISVWDAEGEFLYHAGTGLADDTLSLPRGLFVDHRDRLYVVDAVAQVIRVYDVSGSYPEELFQFGEFGQGDGLFNYPNDIFVDKTGLLYIADRENNRIQVWSY